MRKLNVYRQIYVLLETSIVFYKKKVSRYFNIPQNLLDYYAVIICLHASFVFGPANAD